MHFLNAELLYEKLCSAGIHVRYQRRGSRGEFQNYQYITDSFQPCRSTLYICPYEEGLLCRDASALFCGPWKKEDLPTDIEYYLCEDTNERILINVLEDIFSECKNTEAEVRLALTSASPLHRICEIASDFFHAQCYIHDEQFCFLAYDRRVDMDSDPNFEYSEQYGCYIQSSVILDQFRLNSAYQKTLFTKGCQLWIDPITDIRCLYQNFFLYNQYRGRFLVTLTELTPGRARAIEFFGHAILEVLANEPTAGLNSSQPLARLLQQYAEGKPVPEKMFADTCPPDWPLKGEYLCGIIRLFNNQLSSYMIRSVCQGIQEKIAGSCIYFSREQIFLLINLRFSRIRPSDVRMKMAEQIRESLLKAAVSDEFRYLTDFPVYMDQAAACLDYMEQHQMTNWFGEFRQIAVPFWLRHGLGSLPVKAMLAREIRLLQEYDLENDSDLLDTLRVYMTCERNATLTSQILHIHRSTLPHRLNRITEITQLNLDDAQTRLHLLMSFEILQDTSS